MCEPNILIGPQKSRVPTRPNNISKNKLNSKNNFNLIKELNLLYLRCRDTVLLRLNKDVGLAHERSLTI